MKKRKITIVVICLLVVAGAFFYLYRTDLKDAATKLGILKGAAAGKPAAGSQQGGRAPTAETKAAPEEAKQAEETPTVEIPTDKWQMIGVKTVKATINP